MSLSSLSSVNTYALYLDGGQDFDILLPRNPQQNGSGPTTVKVGPWEFVGFAYQRNVTTNIDVNVTIEQGELTWSVRREATFASNSLFWNPCLPLTSRERIRFTTNGATAGTEHQVILIWK